MYGDCRRNLLSPTPLLSVSALPFAAQRPAEPSVLHQEVSSGFWPATLYLSTEVHHHQHTHQHQHPSTLFQHQPSGILPTPVPPMLATPDRNLPHPHVMLRLAPMAATFVPLPGPFGSLHGAFQPKTCPPQTSNVLDMAPRPRTGSHKLLQKDPRRPGRWNTMHVRIAWQIHHHKLRVKKMQVDAYAINFGVKPEFLTQPPGSDLIQAIPHQRDPIQYSTPLSNPESHSRHPLFGGFGSLSVTAFGGLPNLALNYAMIYHKDNLNAPSGEVGGTPEWWSRKQKTPSSSVCQPERSTEPEQPGRDSTREPQDRDTLREREWGQQLHLPREKMEEKHQGHNAAGTHDSSPAEDKSVPQTMTLEHGQQSNGSRSWESGDRKRRLECKNYIKAKKIKRQREDDQEDFNDGPQPKDPTEKPSLVPTTLTPSSMSMQLMTTGNIIPGLYPVNRVCNLARTQVGTPNMRLIPYHALPWDTPRDPLWDAYRGMDLPVSPCQELVMRSDPLHGMVGARLLEAADCSYRYPHHSFPHPPHHPSLVLNQQERAYLMERERLHLRREENYQHSLYSATMGDYLPHPSLLTSTYSGSHISRVGLTQSSLPNRTLPPGSLSTLSPFLPFSLPLSGTPHRTTS